jgi:hypothetical protein
MRVRRVWRGDAAVGPQRCSEPLTSNLSHAARVGSPREFSVSSIGYQPFFLVDCPATVVL